MILLLLLAIFCSKAVAQEQFVQPAAKIITRFPFTQITGGIVIIKAKLDGIEDSLNFVLDTGSGGISLDSETVVLNRLVAVPSTRTIRGIAGVRTVSFVKNQVMHLPGLTVKELDFHINDYAILTSVYGEKIDGIIGYSFFSRYIIKLSYDSNIMEVYEYGSMRLPRGGFLLKPTINNLPVVVASVYDDHLSSSRFYFDTGAGLCLLMSEDYVRDSSLLRKSKKPILTQAEGLGGKKPMKLTTVKEVRLGPYRFRKVPVHIFEDEFNVTSYPQLGGLIGNDLLRRFNAIINYRDKEIHLQPNTHFNEPFDYSYTGLGIYLVNGNIVIEDVIKHSPGEKAGLKVGDILVSVENAFNNNIQTYKTLLQTAGARLKLLIMRDGELHIKYLQVKNILRN